jgi:micrococcal nuclease
MRRAVPCIALAAFIAAGCSRAALPDAASVSTVVATNAVVVGVVDGDTIDVNVDGASERVRLIGIDTPETKKPDTPVECFGPEATAFTTELLPSGTPVRLERDVEGRDAYGRLLAYVFRGTDGLFVNLAIVEGGFALPFPFEPNTAHAADFAAAARSAAEAPLGLWAHCNG